MWGAFAAAAAGTHHDDNFLINSWGSPRAVVWLVVDSVVGLVRMRNGLFLTINLI